MKSIDCDFMLLVDSHGNSLTQELVLVNFDAAIPLTTLRTDMDYLMNKTTVLMVKGSLNFKWV